MTIDASDGGDGIIYERGRHDLIRAVVMRHGQRIASKYRKTKEAALRNLVVTLAQRLSQVEFSTYSWPDENYGRVVDTLRLTIAEGLEGLAGAKLARDDQHAELFTIGGTEHIVMDIDRLFRGAWTLRWVHKRESD